MTHDDVIVLLYLARLNEVGAVMLARYKKIAVGTCEAIGVLSTFLVTLAGLILSVGSQIWENSFSTPNLWFAVGVVAAAIATIAQMVRFVVGEWSDLRRLERASDCYRQLRVGIMEYFGFRSGMPRHAMSDDCMFECLKEGFFKCFHRFGIDRIDLGTQNRVRRFVDDEFARWYSAARRRSR
jgi:hypothetical protein